MKRLVKQMVKIELFEVSLENGFCVFDVNFTIGVENKFVFGKNGHFCSRSEDGGGNRGEQEASVIV